mmetsp:Transcript_12742/g.28700  ORF Transcript_12742/g.28700 Transcript_12742/m.28700 type:complete len:611 (-) Transcript_12742:78-1910(-)
MSATILKSAAKRKQQKRADEWHSKLVQMEAYRSRRLTAAIDALMEEQLAVLQMAIRAQAQHHAIQSFVETLWEAQSGLVEDIKVGLARDDDDFPGNSDQSLATIETTYDDVLHDVNKDGPALSNASAVMERTSRLMVKRVTKIGLITLHQVVENMRATSSTLMQQQTELEKIGRTVTKTLQESQIKVKQAWDKYFKDMTSSPLSTSSTAAEQGSLSESTSTEVEEQGDDTIVKKQDSGDSDRGAARRSSFQRSEPDSSLEKRLVDRNNSLRAMENVAEIVAALPSPDVWLSEWGYRAHVMEQIQLYDQATQRMGRCFVAIRETETLRRIRLRQDLLNVARNQQKLAVNLEAVAAVGLMNYLERQDQADQTTSQEEEEELPADGDQSNEQADEHENGDEDELANAANTLLETPENSLTLPSLTKSGFVALTTLVKRLGMESENQVLSMLVMTIDGVLYFFDLPSDAKIVFSSSTPLAKAWEAVLAAEFKRQMSNMTARRGSDVVIVVPPPLPSKRFMLAQCSIEMTNVDCVAHFGVPESQGEDFRIELASPRLQIAFIDAFHACKFQEDSSDIMADTDVSENISDVSDSDDDDGDEFDYDAGTDLADLRTK